MAKKKQEVNNKPSNQFFIDTIIEENERGKIIEREYLVDTYQYSPDGQVNVIKAGTKKKIIIIKENKDG